MFVDLYFLILGLLMTVIWLFSEMGESEMNISNITSATDDVLPDLPVTTKKSLEDTIKSLRVETPEDFRFLQESDLVSVMRPIQARTFISVLKETSKSMHLFKLQKP